MGYSLIPSGPIAHGRITIFRQPVPYTAYSLGLDFAYGLEHGDFDAGVMLDGEGEQVATIHGHWGERFIDVLWPLLQWYRPFVVGERQVGLPTLRRIYDKGYTYLYFERDLADRAKPRSDKLGHHARKGDLIIDRLREAISRRRPDASLAPAITIRDQQLLDQLTKFQFVPRSSTITMEEARDEDLRWSAPRGEHDDLVFACAYAWHGLFWLPQFEKPAEALPPMSLGRLFGTPATMAKDAANTQRKIWK